MNAVTSHGAPKITMNSEERDYQERLRQAKAQGDGNPYVSGFSPTPEPQVPQTEEPAPQAFEEPQAEQQANQMGTDALDRRLALYAKASGNADFGNNDRSQTMGIGR